MNVVRTVVLAALVAVAVPAAGAEAQDRPDWTIGAGLSNAGLLFLPTTNAEASSGGFFIGPLGSLGPAVPVVNFFLERRVGERSWLVFGAAGALERRSEDPPPAGSFAVTKSDGESASLSAGLRRVVTRPGAVVDVSLSAVLEGGYVHAVQETTSGTGARASERDIGWFGAVTGGIAVERELTGGLGLRISTPLVGATWSRVERHDDAGTRFAKAAGVFVTVAPRLELRLAF